MDEGYHSGECKTGRGGSHVLFGDPHLEVTLREFGLEHCGLGGFAEIGFKGDYASILLAQLTRGWRRTRFSNWVKSLQHPPLFFDF